MKEIIKLVGYLREQISMDNKKKIDAIIEELQFYQEENHYSKDMVIYSVSVGLLDIFQEK